MVKISVLLMRVIAVWVIFMSAVVFGNEHQPLEDAHEIQRYDAFVVETHIYGPFQNRDKLLFNIEIMNRYEYVLDGYLVYDVLHDTPIDNKGRSVFETRPVVLRKYIPVYLLPFEELNISVEIDLKETGLKEGKYILRYYIIKDRLNIVGNPISFYNLFNNTEKAFLVNMDYGPVPSVRFDKVESHFMGGYGQSGPLINVYALPPNYNLAGYLKVVSLEEATPQKYYVDIYVCEWNDLPIFASNLSPNSPIKNKCEKIETKNVDLKDREDDVVFYIPLEKMKTPATQIVYILRDGAGYVMDIFESRAIMPSNNTNLVALNFMNKNDSVIGYEIVFTGPYYPYISQSTPTKTSVCINDVVCNEHDIPSIPTDNIYVVKGEISSTTTSQPLYLCVINEDKEEVLCKELFGMGKESDMENNNEHPTYLVYVYGVLILALILLAVIYMLRRREYVPHKK